MKKLLCSILSIALLLTLFCPLVSLAVPEEDTDEDPEIAEDQNYSDETFWERWGYETVDEFMEWLIGEIKFYIDDLLHGDAPFWRAWNYNFYYTYTYCSSKEEFLKQYSVSEDEYVVLEEAWQKALDKLREEEIERHNEELEELGGTPGIINVMYNGEFIKFDVAPPERIDGLTFVPIKAYFEFFGAEVSYSELTHKITADFGEWSVSFATNRDTMSVTENGKTRERPIDDPPIIKNGVSFMPIRAVAESFGFDVYWDQIYNTVVIINIEKVAAEIDENFTIANSVLKSIATNSAADRKTYKTVLDLLVSVTTINTLDGDTTADGKANITIISDGKSYSMTGVIDLSQFIDMLVESLMDDYYYNYDDDELIEEIEAIRALGKITVDIIFNYDEGILYIKAPILSELLRLLESEIELDKDAWLSIGGLNEYPEDYDAGSILDALGVGDLVSGITVGELITSSYKNNYYTYSILESLIGTGYSSSWYYNYYSRIYLYQDLMDEAHFANALIGDEEFVKNGDNYNLAQTLDGFLEIAEEYDQDYNPREFDLKIAIKTKDGEISGVNGGFIYREDVRRNYYYSDDDIRYTCDFDITRENIRFSIEIHQKNAQKILVELKSSTAESKTPVPEGPPEGAKVISIEELLGYDDELSQYWPGFIQQLAMTVKYNDNTQYNEQCGIIQ